MTTWRKRLKECLEIKKELKRLLGKLEKQSAKALTKASEVVKRVGKGNKERNQEKVIIDEKNKIARATGLKILSDEKRR